MNPPKALCFAVVAALLISASAGVTGLARDTSCMDVDYRALVSQSDAVFHLDGGEIGLQRRGQNRLVGLLGNQFPLFPSGVAAELRRWGDTGH